MLHGSIWNKIPQYALPVAATGILEQLFNASDIAVVGNFTGENGTASVAAVGANSSIIGLILNLFIGISLGANVVISNAIGHNDRNVVHKAVHTSIIVSVAGGLIVAVIGQFFAGLLLQSLNVPEDVLPLALLYLRIYLIGMPVNFLYNFEAAIFRSIGNTKTPLQALAVSGVLNVILNLFFVIVCKLDVAGVAIASVISQYISAVLILAVLFRSRESYGLSAAGMHIYSDKLRRILRIGIPGAFQHALFAIANLFVQTSVNSFDHILVEGNSAAANADPLVYDMMAAFYTACASFIAQNYGAHQKDRIMKSYIICNVYSFFVGLILGVGLYVLRYPFLSLFTNESVVIEAGIKRLSIMALSYSVSAFMDCTIAASRGLGKTVIPTIMVIMGSCVFRIFWIYTVFAHFRTIQSLYLLYVFSWTLTAIAEIIYFVYIYRRLEGKMAAA